MTEQKTRSGQDALSGGIWLAGAMVGQVLAQLVVVGILARILSPSDFGQVAAASVVIETATGLAQMGMGAAIVQRQNASRLHIRVAFTASVLASAAVSATVYVCAPFLSELLNVPAATPLLRALAFVFLIRGIGAVAEALVAKRRQFKALAARRLFGYVIGYGLVGIAAAQMGVGAWALVLAQLAQAGFTTTLLLISARHPLAPSLHRQTLRELSAFGTGLSAGRIANTLALQADYAVVARLMGPAALGLYARSYQLMRLPALLLGNIVEDVAFPTLSGFQTDRARLSQAYLRALGTMNLFLFPAAAITAILASELINLALGEKWSEAAPLLACFAMAMPFRSTQRLSSTTSRAAGAPWQIAWREFAYFALVLSAASVGAQFGLLQVVIGVSAAILCQFILHTQLASSLTGTPLSALIRAHLSALPATACASVPVLAAATLARHLHAPATVTLLFSVTVGAIAAATSVLLKPKLVLGAAGLAFVDALTARFPKRVRRALAQLRLVPTS